MNATLRALLAGALSRVRGEGAADALAATTEACDVFSLVEHAARWAGETMRHVGTLLARMLPGTRTEPYLLALVEQLVALRKHLAHVIRHGDEEDTSLTITVSRALNAFVEAHGALRLVMPLRELEAFADGVDADARALADSITVPHNSA